MAMAYRRRSVATKWQIDMWSTAQAFFAPVALRMFLNFQNVYTVDPIFVAKKTAAHTSFTKQNTQNMLHLISPSVERHTQIWDLFCTSLSKFPNEKSLLQSSWSAKFFWPPLSHFVGWISSGSQPSWDSIVSHHTCHSHPLAAKGTTSYAGKKHCKSDVNSCESQKRLTKDCKIHLYNKFQIGSSKIWVSKGQVSIKKNNFPKQSGHLPSLWLSLLKPGNNHKHN